MNNVNLSGRLTRDPELKTTASGKSVCNFTMAIDKKMSNEQKDKAKANGDPTADFPQCQCWGHDAEYLCKYGKKGSFVIASGRLQTRSYEDKDGKKVYVTEVICADLQLIRTEPKEDPGMTYLAGGESYTKDQISKDIAAEETGDDLPF